MSNAKLDSMIIKPGQRFSRKDYEQVLIIEVTSSNGRSIVGRVIQVLIGKYPEKDFNICCWTTDPCISPNEYSYLDGQDRPIS